MKKSMWQIGSFLLFVVSLLSSACGPGGPIPMGAGADEVPKFIGEPAEANPLDAMVIPEHPYMADQGRNGMHSDSYISGTYPWSGPLGINAKVNSLKMGLIGGLVATVNVDSQGRLMCVSGDFSGFNLYLLSPTLEILASYPLPQRASMKEFWRTLDMDVIMTDTSGGAYCHLGKDDRPIIANADNLIQIFSVDDTGSEPKWQVDEEYDLNPALPAGAVVTDAMPDWEGKIWFITRMGVVGVLDPSDGQIKTITLADEEIQNALAIAEDGVYIVSDYALYRFVTDGIGIPTDLWRKTYDRGTSIKPGSINQGCGTTPTLLDVPQSGTDPIKLIAITDNADIQDNVLVYNRLTGEKVCEQPVFDEGFSVSENSLIAYGRSIIVENNYLYSSGSPLDQNPRSHPGVARIDLNADCTACSQVWESREASQTTVPKLSIGNGLVYLYTRLDGTPDSIMAWYLTAIDFETGDTVYKKFTGTGMSYNNSYGPITIGPDGTAYIGVFNGIVAVRDGE